MNPRFRSRRRLCLLATLLVSATATSTLAAQTGQVEVWIPRTTRAMVVDALRQRLSADRWTIGPVSDYGARFERRTVASDPLGRPIDTLSVDRLTITFRDLGDTLRVAGRMATVTSPGTATEKVTGRDDSKAMQEVAQILSDAKAAAENRRPASSSQMGDVAAASSPPSAAPAAPVTEPAQSPTRSATIAAPHRKEPALAFVLSLLITGAGQGYNGQWGKGAAMFGGEIVGIALLANDLQPCWDYCNRNTTQGTIGAVMIIGSVLWSVIDAPVTASKLNKRNALAFEPAIVPLRSANGRTRVGLQLGLIALH